MSSVDEGKCYTRSIGSEGEAVTELEARNNEYILRQSYLRSLYEMANQGMMLPFIFLFFLACWSSGTWSLLAVLIALGLGVPAVSGTVRSFRSVFAPREILSMNAEGILLRDGNQRVPWKYVSRIRHVVETDDGSKTDEYLEGVLIDGREFRCGHYCLPSSLKRCSSIANRYIDIERRDRPRAQLDSSFGAPMPGKKIGEDGVGQVKGLVYL